MSATTAVLHSRVQSMRRQIRIPLLVVTLAYTAAWSLTRGHFMADTNVYAQAILTYQHGIAAPDYRSLTSNPFWDFGHLLWRPMGWLAFVIGKPVTQLLAHGNERAEVLLSLFAVNFLAGCGCLLLFFQLAQRILPADPVALCITFALLFSDAFLNYAHSGSPYLVGLAFLIAGIHFSFREESRGSSVPSALAAALMLALSVFFWLPYVFVLPAAIAAPALIYGKNRDRSRYAVLTVLFCAAIGVATYGCVVATIGIRSVSDLKDWILASGHGQLQPHGVRAIARLAFSVPRSFINMDRDGMWLKRYLVHDPYAPVTLSNLFALSLWKLFVFYTTTVIVLVELLRSKQGRRLALVLAASILPIFLFALFIFEAGSIERYIPLYPFVFLACAWVLAVQDTSRFSKLLVILALAATAAVNVTAMSRSKVESERLASFSRIRDLLPQLRPRSLVMAVNEQDSLAEFRQNFPLDHVNLEAQWQNYDMLEINSERLVTWRQDFAKQVLTSWQRQGDVWLPERAFSPSPKPQWNWVEGDDPRVSWNDLPSFFSHFRTGALVGGDDGFVLLQRVDDNQKRLVAISQR